MKNNSQSVKERKQIFKKIFFIITIFLIAFLALGVLAGCKDKKGNDGESNNYLNLGNVYSEAVAEIDTSGGVIQIDNVDSALNGMKITIPSNTFNMPVNFVINSYEISSHKLGVAFNPLTPVIEIKNGEEFGQEVIELEIPIALENSFAMGFYIDQFGSLEAIPSLALEDNKITLGVKHFSKIVVTDISLSTFQNLSSIQGKDYDTGFAPQLDDWHYTNYGSAIAGGGHCGGQSLTMAWYYTEKHLKEKAQRLHGRFDNNEEIDTPDFWQDDNNAYRFSSVVQANAKWADADWIKFINYSVANPEKTYQAFAYSIKQTKAPQFMAIFPDGPGIGHAIVAYKVEGNKIYVADPNYPGQTDRYVEYNPSTKTFLPYSSGANATDITENGATSYTKIVYAAKTALIDYSFIATEYEKMLQGTVGDNEFPDTRVEVLTKHNSNSSLIEYQNVNREITLGNEFIDSLPSQQQQLTIIKLTPLGNNLVYSLYLGNNVLPVNNPTVLQYEGALGFVVDWALGANEYGLLVEQYDDGYYDYVDFIRIRVNINNAQPSFTITFDTLGGSFVNAITQVGGSAILAPDSPTKSGYVFGGWYQDSLFNNPYVFSNMPNQNIVLYAKWIDATLQSSIEGKYYLYTIDGRQDLGITEYQFYDIANDGTYCEEYKAKQNNSIISGSGTWSLNNDILTFNNGNGTYQVVADGQYLKDLYGEKPYFIYKKHTPVDISVTITFDSNGGSAISAITQKPGTNLAAPVAPTRAGYRFGGWYLSKDFETQYFFGAMPNRNMMVFAKWIDASSTQKVNLIYAFHSNYAYNPSIYTFEYDAGEDFPYEHLEYWTTKPAGYLFLGYYIDSACTTPLTYTTVPNHDVFIYTKLQLMTESDMLGKYYKNEQGLQSYLDYYYIEFLAGGIFKVGYKRNDNGQMVENEGTWSSLTSNDIIVFYVDWPNTSFNKTAVFYEDWVSCDGSWYREPYSRE